MSGRYAKGTDVDIDRSLMEIKRTLERYGADSFGYAQTPERIAIQFRMRGYTYQIPVRIPPVSEFVFTENNRRRGDKSQVEAQQAELRRRFRVLLLLLKAKLEAVADGQVDMRTEFMAHLVLPSGRTIGEEFDPHIDAAMEGKRLPTGVFALPLPAGEVRR